MFRIGVRDCTSKFNSKIFSAVPTVKPILTGLCGSILQGSGFVGSLIIGFVAEKIGRMEEVAKISFAIASLMSILISIFLRKSNKEIVLALCCSLFGAFGFGMYPIGLELSVENTYPVDEAAGTALIFLSGQIQGYDGTICGYFTGTQKLSVF